MRACSRSAKGSGAWRSSAATAWTCRLWKRRPADGDDDGVCQRFPGVVDARPPGYVVALTLKDDAALGEVELETALDQQEKRGALVVGSPFGALVAGRVDAPLDFDVLCRPDAG